MLGQSHMRRQKAYSTRLDVQSSRRIADPMRTHFLCKHQGDGCLCFGYHDIHCASICYLLVTLSLITIPHALVDIHLRSSLDCESRIQGYYRDHRSWSRTPETSMHHRSFVESSATLLVV